MLRRSRTLAFTALWIGGFACSSSTSAPNDAPSSDTTLSDSDDVADPAKPKKKRTPVTKDSGASADSCETPSASKCATPFPGSEIRGIVQFDPKALGDSTSSNVALFLRHSFTLKEGEETIGGRLHAYKYLKNVDITSGSVPFSIDLCEHGTAMWSEENGAFNLVAILDANGDNNPDASSLGEIAVQTPTPGEWAGMTTLRVSCHAKSPCVELTANCDKGKECTTFTPVTTVACETPSCPSDDSFCTK